MNLKRREFLLLSTVGTISAGFAGCATAIKVRNSNSVQVTKPVVPENKVLYQFVSVADTGTGDNGQYAVAKAMTNYHTQNPYDLVVLAGDNIYTNGEIEKINAVFERPYAELLKKGVKFQAALGNHDIRTANGDLQLKYAAFNYGGRYYTYNRGPVQFFVLDTNGNADFQTQLSWLDTELSKSKAPWKIVYGHHPIYASGVYGSNPAFIKAFTPIFTKHNVQLYINGHEHHYERTIPINGTTYLICGGGAGTRPVGKNEWTAYSAEKLSFAAYKVYADKIEVSGIGTDNQIFDKGIIPIKTA
ncbi:acid phosphatase [Dulcicalothrix desertica PCC 7102]|uniref:Acid phosphatase n=1 Tax=Dulcicalothrix desertica PCC 7102 TaxID=232991 RepID=A0A433VDQ0_9CYAN|nr:metallophosphoesterase [Dulcicalothrix desertica]RUT04235.1 acid phosphatase [Dulcicalothrix desertica PCC 7102]TWH51461.1 3',5'-cyclic AMP phosphodiesterase CpdA [Dulcicalothrix desertica PCC 7102]